VDKNYLEDYSFLIAIVADFVEEAVVEKCNAPFFPAACFVAHSEKCALLAFAP